MSKKTVGYIYILVGAVLWGTIGLWVDTLHRAGFSSFQIVTLRVISAAVMMVIYLGIKDRRLLKIDWRHSHYFVGTGIVSIVFFNWAYFTTIEMVSLSVAVVLLYTGPLFVVLLSRFIFGEPLTRRKIVALGITLVGCMLVAKLIPITYQPISWSGILIGLSSGFFYALYSIFGKKALRQYDSLTVITYTFIFASLVMLPLSGITIPASLLATASNWLLIITLGLLPTAIAYLLYTWGLHRLESGRASITATVEPVVAALIGVFIFNEALTFYQLLGMMGIIGAVILLQFKTSVR